MIDRHPKPYRHLFFWHCAECRRYGRWHASRGLAAHEFDRHVCIPFTPEDAA